MSVVRRGRLGVVVAGRPLISGTIFAAAAIAINAYLFRTRGGEWPAGAVDAMFAVFAAFPAAVLVASASPNAAMGRIVVAAALAAAGFAVPAFAADIEGLLTQMHAAIIAAGLLTASLLVLAGPLWRGEARFAFAAGLAVLLGVNVTFAWLGLSKSAPAFHFMTGIASTAFVASAFVFAFSSRFSEGGGFRRAGAVAVTDAAPVLLVGGALAAGAAMLTAAPGMLSADVVAAATAYIPPAIGALVFASGAAVLSQQSETLAVAHNHRARSMASAMRGVRALLPPSSALAALSVAGVVAVLAAFERQDPPYAEEIIFVVLAGFLIGVMSLSIRTIIFACGLLLLVLFAGGWAASAAGALPQASDARIAALSPVAMIVAIYAIGWRNARNPRRKAREVTSAAMSNAAPAALLSTIISLGLFAALSATGWGVAPARAFDYLLTGAVGANLFAPIYMTALGAVFGRDA